LLDFRIRAARPRDCDELMALIVDHAQFERNSVGIGRERLLELLADDPSPIEIFVASDKTRLAGYGAMTVDFSLWRGTHWAHLDCLFVSEKYRSLRIGKQLLAHAAALAKQHSADRLEWQTPEWNQRAIAFYRREGASSERKLRFFKSISS